MLDGHSSGDLLLGGGGGAKVPERKDPSSTTQYHHHHIVLISICNKIDDLERLITGLSPRKLSAPTH